MKDRIRQIMESQHMTQKTFANFIGMSEGALSSVFNGRTRPTLNIVELIKGKIPGINTDWLVFGSGKMFEDAKSTAADEQTREPGRVPQEALLDFSDNIVPKSTVVADNRTPMSAPNDYKNFPKNNLNSREYIVRKITEIRVFYDDQTWESFVPKK